jgi:hypothetical protein
MSQRSSSCPTGFRMNMQGLRLEHDGIIAAEEKQSGEMVAYPVAGKS